MTDTYYCCSTGQYHAARELSFSERLASDRLIVEPTLDIYDILLQTFADILIPAILFKESRGPLSMQTTQS